LAESSSRPRIPKRCEPGTRSTWASSCSSGGGAVFTWTDVDGQPTGGATVWTIKAEDDDGFQPGSAPFMVNYRVADLHALVAALKAEGCDVLDKIDESELGKFAWVIDPEGNKVELWEPPPGQ
jgi:predicted enzyme related to lactoylglutathione lyase